MSLVGIGTQPLSRQRVFPSPQKQGGGGTLACGWGVGGSPNSDEGHTLWYSLYVRTLWVYPLCSHLQCMYAPATPLSTSIYLPLTIQYVYTEVAPAAGNTVKVRHPN